MSEKMYLKELSVNQTVSFVSFFFYAKQGFPNQTKNKIVYKI